MTWSQGKERPWLDRAVEYSMPAEVIHGYYAFRRRFRLDRACRAIGRVSGHEIPSRAQLSDLAKSWDNSGYQASVALLTVIATQLRGTSGPVLECGSGISTVMMGLMTRRSQRPIWSLEHEPQWADRVEAELARWKCSHTRVIRAPLADRGEYAWYGAPPEQIPGSITFLVIDGPPGVTKGGRRGALHEVRGRLAPGAVVILDDAQREGEQEALRDWTEHCGLTLDPDIGIPFPASRESGVAVGRVG